LNKTTIEWCDLTYNPVSGCRHGCRNVYCYNTMKPTSALNRFGAKFYDHVTKSFKTEKDWRKRETIGHKCYVAKKGERYPHGYDPTWYEKRLWEPRAVKIPQRIFTIDVGDLFGHWVPITWIKKVIGVMTACDWHTFYCLTKNPRRYAQFTFPGNCWLGATVCSDKDIKQAQTLQGIDHEQKFLSIEPLHGPVTFSLAGIGWVIIGSETGKNPPVPDPAWVDGIVAEAKRVRAKIFMKDNLLQHYRGNTIYKQTP